MKRLGLILLTCLVSQLAYASNVCGKNSASQQANLKKLIDDYTNLDSKIGSCIVAPEYLLSDSMYQLNDLLDVLGKPREYNKLNFLRRAASEMLEGAKRYDELLSRRSVFNSTIDIPRRAFLNGFLPTLKYLYQNYKFKTGRPAAIYSALENLDNSYPNSTAIDLEIAGILLPGQSNNILKKYLEIIPIVDLFLNDLVKMIVKYQPKRYQFIVGMLNFNDDFMFDFYIFASKINLSLAPESILDVLSYLPTYIKKLVDDYKTFANHQRNISEFDLKFLSIPNFSQPLNRTFQYANLIDLIGVTNNSYDVFATALIIEPIMDTIYAEYSYYLKNPLVKPVAALNASINKLEMFLPGVKAELKKFNKVIKQLQPTKNQCTVGVKPSIKSTTTSPNIFIDVITLAMIYLKNSNYIKLGPIENSIDTIRNNPAILQAFLKDYDDIKSGKKIVDENSYILLDLTLGILIYDGWFLQENKAKLNIDKYVDVKAVSDQAAANYFALAKLANVYSPNGNYSTTLDPSSFVEAIRKALPSYKKLNKEIVKIYSDKQGDRDVKIVTQDAENLVSVFNSRRNYFGLSKQSLFKEVISLIPKNLQMLLDACEAVEWKKCQKVDEYTLEQIKFWTDVLEVFGEEFLAVHEMFGLENEEDNVKSLVQDLIKQLWKLRGIYEYKLDYEQHCSGDSKPITITKTKTKTKTVNEGHEKTITKWETKFDEVIKEKIRTKTVDNWHTKLHTIHRDNIHPRDVEIRTKTVVEEKTHTETVDRDVVRTVTDVVKEKVTKTVVEAGERGDKVITVTKWRTKAVRDKESSEEFVNDLLKQKFGKQKSTGNIIY